MKKTIRTVAYVNLSALEENYRAIAGAVGPDVALLPVIKADAYGHGAIEVGRRLEAIGATHLAVATVQEGREVREAGISTPIIVLSGALPWDSLDHLVEYDLVPVISTPDTLERIRRLTPKAKLRVHIKVDTGMGRLGFGRDEVSALVSTLVSMAHVDVEGIMSHFPASDLRDELGLKQIDDFRSVLETLAEHGIRPKHVHMANSGAIYTYPEARFTMVRPGIMLYGSYPGLTLRHRVSLKPVMKWVSHVAFVRLIPPGSYVSYGRTYVTSKETRVAYIPIGYADGYPISLSNRGTVMIGGKGCPVLGRVCMEWIMADATELPEIAPGDDVVLLGDSGGEEAITADDIAEQIGTIPYELLCGVSKRVPRQYD